MGDKHSSQKILVYITLVIVLLIGSATAVVAWHTHQNGKGTQSAKHSTATTSTAQNQEHSPSPVTYQGEDGKTALEILQKKANVVTKDSSYGQYVDSINGIAGGTGGKYWAFYVNGKQASVGAGAYTTKSTDVITWKFE